MSQPSPRPASCPPCLDCPRVSSRSPLHARSALQGRPRGRALASTCMSWQLDAADAGCMRPTAHPAERVRRHAPWALHHSGSVRACPHQTSHPVLTHEAQDADGSRTAEIASHGRLTACRSRLTGYPDRAYDRRASLFFRRGALCMLECVVQGSCVHSVGFRTAVCVIRRPLFRLGSHTTLQDTNFREHARECALELELWSCVAKRFTGRYSS